MSPSLLFGVLIFATAFSTLKASSLAFFCSFLSSSPGRSMPMLLRSNSPQSLSSRLKFHSPKELLSLRTISFIFEGARVSGKMAQGISVQPFSLAASSLMLPPRMTYFPLYGTTMAPRASVSSGVCFMLSARSFTMARVQFLGFLGTPGIWPSLSSSSVSLIFLCSIAFLVWWQMWRCLCKGSKSVYVINA